MCPTVKNNGHFGNGRHAEIMSLAGDVTPAILKNIGHAVSQTNLKGISHCFPVDFSSFVGHIKQSQLKLFWEFCEIHATSSSGFSEPRWLPLANDPNSRYKVTNLLPLNRLAKSFITFQVKYLSYLT